jgi:Uma2 family endonuclease
MTAITITVPPANLLTLPNQDQLPCDDGEPMETQRHKMQMDLLIETLYPWLEARDNGYIGGNMFIYYSSDQLKNQDFKGPDFFAVLDVPKTERKSWVVWEEGKAPDIVIELLSESTAKQDKTTKKLVYQNQMRVPEYFWYDPFNPQDWQGFRLVGGSYQALELDSSDRYLSEKLNLALVRWQGDYQGVDTMWLRWITLDGQLLPTKTELVQQAQSQARQAQNQARQAQSQAQQAQAEAQQAQVEARQAQNQVNKLAAKLRDMGINPDAI